MRTFVMALGNEDYTVRFGMGGWGWRFMSPFRDSAGKADLIIFTEGSFNDRQQAHSSRILTQAIKQDKRVIFIGDCVWPERLMDFKKAISFKTMADFKTYSSDIRI